jgi:hypothetical protein
MMASQWMLWHKAPSMGVGELLSYSMLLENTISWVMLTNNFLFSKRV